MLIKTDIHLVNDPFQDSGLLHGKLIRETLQELNLVSNKVEVLPIVLVDRLLVVSIDIIVALVHALAFGRETTLDCFHRGVEQKLEVSEDGPALIFVECFL